MNIQMCEICGKLGIAGYMYSIMASWVVTGHAYVPAFSCETAQGSQHWGCTPEHAMQALQKCLAEHLHVGNLLEKHAATGIPRYSEEDAIWAQNFQDDFHIVEIVYKGTRK